MLERLCEVLIRKNTEIELAETLIKQEAESLVNTYNEAIRRGYPPHIARENYIQEMIKITNHFLPIYKGATPDLVLTLSLKE
jgi:hypothetical protein